MDRILNLYYTSDIHGYLYPTTYGDTLEKPLGLFSCAGDFKKDGNTLVLDGGDMLQGSALAYYCSRILNSPKPLADCMNDCGYDYCTLGNHDFNYGQAYQREYLKNLQGRCLCQNVKDEEGNTLYPYVIRQMENGLKVGIVGIVTDFINVWEKKENLQGIRIVDPFAEAEAALREMKAKADVTICLYHGGFEADLETGKLLSSTTENVGYRICSELDFDILLTGHQHVSVDGRKVCGTYTVQPLDEAKEYHFLEVTVAEDGKVGVHSEKRKADPKKTDRRLSQKYRPLEDQIQKWLNEPVGHLSRDLMPDTKIRMACFGSPIANLFNRVQTDCSQAEISVCSLPNDVAGFHKEVSTRDVIATYPYANTLAVCRMTGKQLKQAMERSAEYFAFDSDGELTVAESFLIPKQEHYNFDYFSGVDYEMDPAKPVGSRVVKLEREGKTVKDTDEFAVCLNNYRYSGAGGYPMYPECPLIRAINVEMVEILLEYFRTHEYVEI